MANQAPNANTLRPRDRSRELDIVLLGATGFTGKLVAQYLATHTKDTDLRWALAGRNATKLEALRQELGLGQEIPIIIADSHDAASLNALAARTSVVCTTVGPYAKYGSALVAACVEHGTDYCDLTGEVHWVRKMLDEHHERAQQTGARIVHFCGFDSIPSDLGTLLLQRHAIERHGRPAKRVHYYMARASGGFSGGTIASMINTIEQVAQDPSLRRILGHPYSLNPPDQRKGPDGSDQFKPKYDPVAKAWTGPFVMAPVNTRVVRRSNALLDYLYGKDFEYSEVTRFGSGPQGAVMATLFSVGMLGFMGALTVPVLRQLLSEHVLPAPGEGPSQEAMERGFFETRLVGELDNGQQIKARVGASRDPGYGATAIMLSQSALCLALDGQQLQSPGGVITPAVAMGATLISRLQDAGMTLKIDS